MTQEMLEGIVERIRYYSDENGYTVLRIKSYRVNKALLCITLVDLMSNGTGEQATDALLEAFQEWEDENFLEDLGENTKRGLYEVVTLRDTDPEFRALNPLWPTNDGRYLGILPGTPPKGFKGEPLKVGNKKRKHRQGEHELHIVQRLVPNHDHDLYERCKLAWQMRFEGRSVGEIHKATKLFKTTGGYTSFFKNKIYVGVLEYGGKTYENFIEPMIPREWWEAEQKNIVTRSERMKGHRASPHLEPRRVGSRHLLSGLVYCGAKDGEEHTMLGDTVPGNAKRSQWDFYICSIMKNSRGERCKCKRIGAEALNHTVIEKIMTDILTRENLRPIADELVEAMTEMNHDVNDRLVKLQRRLEEIQSAISKLMDVIETAGMSPNIQKRLAEREAEERQLISEIADNEALIVRARDIPKITNKKLDKFIASIRETLMGDDIELARTALKRFVAKIVIQEKTGTIYYSFPFQDISRLQFLPVTSLISNQICPQLIRLRTAA